VKRLHGWDAYLLDGETPNVPTHTLKIAVLDPTDFGSGFTFEVFKRAVQRYLHLFEPLCYALVDIPFKLHHPMWLERSDIDLDYHLRQVHVPSPGGRRELDELVGEIAATLVDRSRPLWEMYFVEGLADNRCAIVAKVHHALADGVASANLMRRAMTLQRPTEDETPLYVPDPPPSKAELLRVASRDHVQMIEELPRLLRDIVSGVSRLRRRARERGENPDLAHFLSPPKTFINHVVSSGRRFATATLSLADVKQVSKQLNATVNDMVLATAAGALRSLLLRYDGHADQPIIASVPAVLDTSPDRHSGNEFGCLLVSLPVHVTDPLRRVRLVTLSTGIAKENFQLFDQALVGRLVAYVPTVVAPSVFRWVARHEARNRLMNVTISNVPGPHERGRVGGVTVNEIYSVGPLLGGSAMNITVWSYVDQLNISVLIDDCTLDDAHEATVAMIQAFAEIRRATGFSDELTTVASAMPQAAAV